MKRYLDPKYVVLVEHDGKPPGRVGGRTVWSLPWMISYSTPMPRTGRRQTHRYRVCRTLADPVAPFILVRGERRYLTPPLTRKVLS